MGRLIVVSNRVSPPGDAAAGTVGGLAMAISAALREYSGIWFGWSGQTRETFTGQLSIQQADGVTVALVDLEEQDRQEYYNGYANRTLWPLFHYRTDLVAYERSFSEGYARVNSRFAETLAPLVQPDDFIWVQDYHLLPLARQLRQRDIANRIGFFLHIPWPARRLLTTLPRHAQLVEGLFDYDLIGFQTHDSRDAFADYIVQAAGGSVTEDGVATAFGKRTRIGAFPIGIDAESFASAAHSDAAMESFQRARSSLLGRKMILGVDRLDYSKGLEERFLAYEQFLVDHPDQQEKVFLLQIATPSRDEVEAYQDIRSRLESVSGRINGAFADVDWVPIRYVNRGYRRDVLAGIYRAAHIGLVTPLRDGMNLVAKEYVAAQDPEDPGVLILSELAGAAEQMGEALIVNPFSREEVAEAIRRGLEMPLEERKARWDILSEGVNRDDVTAWRDSFVAALQREKPGQDADRPA
ncbi:MAG: alpha,alpha-trehalose-phosphate synthase (UDP-forming) [Phenylobacterium sp.]|uniref:alpha,alpha-trehalose-phosphate synthase (UDP-forming) n=1 Tax=Phenylobacterium sp. TaxID=1871053 RepID=UPI00272238C9|nr:alpha,alpha-trehalose-phosphate synthase (UDP-forming) [Phenylobacterium sp.]MDO9249827.1 alpha,alpha-trehalose-phosphate synthase (UDP-forming) [Phenylobacterium sp.]MDP3867508.1 alpha,alpha-trehalose-phosphate synthase (UDP-forming) [Phenylobacterium sp.]